MKLEIKNSSQTGWLTITADTGRKFDVEQYEEIEEIVRRVNLHDELIAGIKYAYDCLENCPENTGDKGDQAYQSLKELIVKIS